MMKKTSISFFVVIACFGFSPFTVQATWQPPIGIPTPTFGINETYRMYDTVGKRNSALTYTQNAEGGFYTHYVDNTQPICAQTVGNGTPASPLCYIPAALPAGSIVEVHNSAQATGPSGEVLVSGVGTASMPIFIRGINLPRIERPVHAGFYANSKYLIIEGLSFFGGGVLARRSDPAAGGEVFA